MNTCKSLSDRLPALANMVQGRDYITTKELARLVCLKEASVRRAYQTTGFFSGIRPLTLGKSLLWPVVDVVRMFESPTRSNSNERNPKPD